MQAVLTAALPVFALIFTGWLAARSNLLGSTASEVLNRLVIYLALPALLFRSMAQVAPTQSANGAFILTFAAGLVPTFALAFFANRGRGTPLADISIEALSNGYANAGFMGIPLCLVLFGPAAMAPAVIATLMTACLAFGASIAIIEFSRHRDRSLLATGLKVAQALARNPLVLAPVLGMAWSRTGWPLPGAAENFLALLGNAASPCALIAIGLFLAKAKSGGSPRTVTRVVAAKLLLQPAVTAVMAFGVLSLPSVWAWTAVLMAALPIGTGPFMLAQLYGRDAAVASRAILLSTLLSVFTISILVACAPQATAP